MPVVMLPEIPDLPAELAALLAQVPAGRVTTFGDLARALGDIVAARWVATELLEHDDWPWHRVLLKSGELPGKPARQRLQQQRLHDEGVSLVENWQSLAVQSFQTRQPLQCLAQWQVLVGEAELADSLTILPQRVAGLDVSYRGNEASGAYVLFDRSTQKIVEVLTICEPVRFPFISGYLTFRELPTMLTLVDRAARQGLLADVLVIDGTGRLHPRRAGIASTVSLLTKIPAVGVAKHQLCGVQDGANGAVNWLAVKGQRSGAMIPAGTGERRLFVSPGAGISLEQSVELVQSLLLGHRLPEPIWHADRLSRVLARSGKS